ncbi:heptaprenyl diphosphate synthase component 1 [Desmospora activa]|uniref:Heptaprenyl diphosphate synthase subunit 1 n=1 Tax=Desmospora activa DSM 45169 TaxID=1121389 RepID=A0A2T4Z9V6_9BACL|nr:heptaprenyl diphosphate synthase component 1 [Desmospora activa]PTM58678.1 heptaprenyl diphosphate synthase subunit 1 [Desmospora activa DSM 45169]
MTVTENRINLIIADIERQASHTFVDQNIQRPGVPAFFVTVLYHALRSRPLSLERVHLYCVTTTLLQMALDTHERISADENGSLYSRQLTVLAGDYFSSLFYQTLSQAGEIEGITCLSEAVCKVNEAKMELYYLRKVESPSGPMVVDLMRRIHGGLIAAVSSFFCQDGNQLDPWPSLAGHLMALDRMNQAPDVVVGVPDHLLQSLAADTWRLAKEVRPLDVRHELLHHMQRTIAPHVHEGMVREG